MDGKVDIRDDEEQLKKGQEVLELLVAAGYFRARIKVYLFFCFSYKKNSKLFYSHACGRLFLNHNS